MSKKGKIIAAVGILAIFTAGAAMAQNRGGANSGRGSGSNQQSMQNAQRQGTGKSGNLQNQKKIQQNKQLKKQDQSCVSQ